MLFVVAGRFISFLLFVAAIAVVCYFLWSGAKGREPKLRTMPQIQAIEEGVSRAIETGKPVYYQLHGELQGAIAPMTLAAINTLRHTAFVCAQRGAEFIPLVITASLTPFVDGIVKEACLAAGRPESYHPVVYRDYAEGAVILEEFTRRGVGMLVMVGPYYGNSAVVMSEARRQGGLIIAGTARYFLQGSTAMHADYPAFMEDVYAIGSIASNDNVVRITLVASDYLKMTLVGITILLTALGLAGVAVMDWFKV